MWIKYAIRPITTRDFEYRGTLNIDHVMTFDIFTYDDGHHSHGLRIMYANGKTEDAYVTRKDFDDIEHKDWVIKSRSNTYALERAILMGDSIDNEYLTIQVYK